MSLPAGPAHVLATPIGPLTVLVADGAVRAVRFARTDGTADVPEEATVVSRDEQVVPDATCSPDPVLVAAVEQLREYFAGARRRFELPVDAAGTVFQQRCWKALLDVPYATTTTYGQQAARLGDPRSVRAVGAANGQNPIPVVIPCHRIIGADGRLVGFGGGLAAKAWLLDHEQRVAGVQLPF